MPFGNIVIPDSDSYRFACSVIEKLKSEGCQAYLVGGCVRDMLLGSFPEDYDIATSARPILILKLYPDAGTLGIRFGVLKIADSKHHVQAATFRKDDPKSDGRRPNRIFFAGLKEDSARRDFTINAIYYDPLDENIIDLYEGINDIESRIIRIIGNPKKRLREDHLRILRAVRFAARFNFQIEAVTFSALKEASGLLKNISPDRIKDELTRSLCEGDKVYSLELLHNLQILPILWDIFDRDDGTLYSGILKSFNDISCSSPLEIWTAFFNPWVKLPDWQNQIETAMLRLNFSRKWKRHIHKKLENH